MFSKGMAVLELVTIKRLALHENLKDISPSSYSGQAAVSVHKYSETSQLATSCPFRKNYLKILGVND